MFPPMFLKNICYPMFCFHPSSACGPPRLPASGFQYLLRINVFIDRVDTLSYIMSPLRGFSYKCITEALYPCPRQRSENKKESNEKQSGADHTVISTWLQCKQHLITMQTAPDYGVICRCLQDAGHSLRKQRDAIKVRVRPNILTFKKLHPT